MTKFFTHAALAATVATGLFAAPAMAADTETFTATARIVSPLTLSLDNGGLNFGTITMLPTLLTSQDVVVGRVNGSAATSCGTDLTCTTPTPAKFSVVGSVGQPLTITTTPLAVLTSGGNTVTFAIDAPTGVSLAGSGPDAGKASFEIGGKITIDTTTVDGTYTGDVAVTVEYS